MSIPEPDPRLGPHFAALFRAFETCNEELKKYADTSDPKTLFAVAQVMVEYSKAGIPYGPETWDILRWKMEQLLIEHVGLALDSLRKSHRQQKQQQLPTN